MKALYFDTFAGISGDTTVAALIDLGVSLERLRSEISKLSLGEVVLDAGKVKVGPIVATRFEVRCPGQSVERTLPSIQALLTGSSLSSWVKSRASRVFEALAEAEGKVHGIGSDEVHFHEVGAVDSIVDVVGSCLGLEALGIERVFVGSLPLGCGLIDSQHGPLPVPAPATVELLRGFRVEMGNGSGEMVTPTGAALLVGLGAEPASTGEMVIEEVGYGAASRKLEDRPNALRLLLGQVNPDVAGDECEVLESNIDDLNPEFYDHVSRRLFAAGALDVTLLPLQMKKGRPGTLLSVISPPGLAQLLAGIILEETSTVGLRIHRVRRVKIARECVSVCTTYGEIRVKIARRPGGAKTAAPEYEDCRQAAAKHGVSLRAVYDAAIAAAQAG